MVVVSTTYATTTFVLIGGQTNRILSMSILVVFLSCRNDKIIAVNFSVSKPIVSFIEANPRVDGEIHRQEAHNAVLYKEKEVRMSSYERSNARLFYMFLLLYLS